MGTVMVDRHVTVILAGLMLFVATIHCYQEDVTDDLVVKTNSHGGKDGGCRCDPCKTGSSCQNSIKDNVPKFNQKYQLVEINEDDANAGRPLSYNSTTYPSEAGCACPIFVYEITGIENSIEPGGFATNVDVFEIDASTGRIFVTRTLPYELFKITVTVRNTKTGAFDDTKLTVMTRAASQPNQFHPIDQQGYHHHIQKRSVIPTEPGFTLTRMTAAPTGALKVGEYIRFKLTITFPATPVDMTVEIFAPDNETCVMILCDVVVTKGGNIATTSALNNIAFDSKIDVTKCPDRAIIGWGTVSNSGVDIVNVAASSIDVEYEAIVVKDAAITPGENYISIGAAYDSENKIYVAMDPEDIDNTADPTVTDNPTFTITGDSSMAIGQTAPISMDIVIPYAYDEYTLKAITPLGTVGVMSICSMSFVGFGNYFQCGNDASAVTDATVADTQGVGYNMGTLGLGKLLNRRPGAASPGTSVTANALLHLYNQPSLVGQELSLGITMEMGTTQIWAGSYNITVNAAATSGFPVPAYVSHTTSLTNWDATIGDPFEVQFRIRIPPSSGVAGDFVLKLVAPFDSGTPVFQVCKLEIVSVGEEFPCLKLSDLTTVYTTREAGGSYADEAEIGLGMLTNLEQFSIADDDTILVKAIMTPLMGHPTAAIGQTHTAVLGLTVSGAYTQIYSMAVNLAATSSMTTVSNATAPTFSFSHSISSDLAVTSHAKVIIDMTTTNNILYPELGLEFLMPADTDNTYFHVCRLEIESNGQNVPCITPEWANKNVQIFSQYDDKIIDRIKMKLGRVCNDPFSVDPADDVTRFALYYKVLDIPAMAADSQHYIDAGIAYSTNYLWVGRLSSTVKRGQTYSPSATIHAALQRNDTLVPLPINTYAIFSLLLKIPSGTTFDLKVKATSSAQGFDICSVRVVTAGHNLPCLTEEGITKTETTWPNGGTSSITSNIGAVRGFGSGTSILANDIFDDDTAIIEIVGHANQNVAQGTYDLTVETYLDTAMSNVDTKSITGIATTEDQSSLSTAIPTPVSLALSVGELGSTAVNTNIAKGQVQRVLMTAIIPEGSLYKLEFAFVISSNYVGKLEICDAAILYVGENLLCVDSTTEPTISATTNPYNDKAEWVLDYVQSNPTKPGDQVANSIVFEAFVRLVPNGKAALAETVSVSGTVKTFNDLTVESLDFTVADIATFIDSVKDPGSITNVSLISIDPAPPITMSPGQNQTIKVIVTVPVNSSSRFLFDVLLPGDGQQACLTVSEINVIGALGRNVHCDATTNSKEVVYTPLYEDTIGAGTNNKGSLDVFIVTNTGVSHRKDTFSAGDDDVEIQVVVQMCDCSLSTHGSTHKISFGNKLANYIFIHDNDFQVARANSEKSDIVVDLSAAAGSTSSNVIIQGIVYHSSLSEAEGRNLTVSVALPLYTLAPGSIVTTSTKQHTSYATDRNDLIEISFDDFYFTDIYAFQATLTINNNLELPVGYSASDTRFIKWTETNFFRWSANFDSEDWYPNLQSSNGQWTYSVDAGTGTSCNAALGFSNNAIQNCQITGTKGRDSAGEPKNGRKGASTAWRPVVGDGIGQDRFVYFEVYFGNKHSVTKLDIEQNTGLPHFATDFESELSLDGRAWFGKETFSIPTGTTLSTVPLSNKIKARYMRIKVTNDTSNGIASELGIGFELYGCEESTDILPADVCGNADDTFSAMPQADRRFLADANNRVYVCDKDTSSVYGGVCSTSGDDGTTWTPLGSLGGLIGFDPSTGEIYGYAPDLATVVVSADSGVTFNGRDIGDLNLATLTSAIDVPEVDTVELEQSFPHSTYRMGNWGATNNGLFYLSSQKYQWTAQV